MMGIKKWTKHLVYNQIPIYPLIIYRIVFGLTMFFSTCRFVIKGWIHDLYLTPKYFFTYLWFDWVNPISEDFIYIAFIILIICSILITLGLLYRASAIIFFLLFTYIELIDKTNYLNHYYFISLISFIIIFLPANKLFSLDIKFNFVKKKTTISAWKINIIKFQIGIVYFFAGIAKINYHWLFEAQPLTNWLKHQSDFPLIGNLLTYDITAFLFSWFGALFDLCIFFILISKKWRVFGYFLVVIFHVMTSIMFPIGVFPLVMIASTLIFFSDQLHISILKFLSKKNESLELTIIQNSELEENNRILKVLFIAFFVLQLLLPLRYLLYPGKLFWTEQGYRFSWRVMLIEKAGYAQFFIHEPKMDRKMLIDNKKYLTAQQEKMMATQPDMILQFAHFISSEFKDSTIIETNGEIICMGEKPKVTAQVKVSLFNKGSKDFVNSNIDLSKEERGLKNKEWILPYED